MNVIQADHSLWKIVFGFMLVVGLLIFVGALSLAGADIFNGERARAEAALMNSRTALEAQRGQIDLSFYTQRLQEEAQLYFRMMQAKADYDVATMAETLRVQQAENDRRLASRDRFDRVLATVATLAGGGFVVVVLYTLLLVAQRGVDRLLPPRVVKTAPAGAVPFAPPAPDPWRNPAFRASMRRQARQREMDKRAARPAAARAPAAPPPRANGHQAGPRPAREREMNW
ncbi:MAG: hypothetical protein R3C43_19665 [Chloroflexota bacterium]